MILRNRTDPTAADLAELYGTHNDARRWAEHRLRVAVTVELARYRFADLRNIVDPAAGSCGTVQALAVDGGRVITGDLAPDAPVTYPGTDALETLTRAYADGMPVGNTVVILGEILEHVPDPGMLLATAQLAGDALIVSTPLDEPEGINPEHVWRWDKAGILELFDRTGWRPLDYVELAPTVPNWPHPFRIQIHTAETRH